MVIKGVYVSYCRMKSLWPFVAVESGDDRMANDAADASVLGVLIESDMHAAKIGSGLILCDPPPKKSAVGSEKANVELVVDGLVWLNMSQE